MEQQSETEPQQQAVTIPCESAAEDNAAQIGWTLEGGVARMTNQTLDPRLQQPPFSTCDPHFVVRRHKLRAQLAFNCAQLFSLKNGRLLYIAVACDVPREDCVSRFTPDIARKCLRIAAPRDTEGLPGILPLVIGGRYKLTIKHIMDLNLTKGSAVSLEAIALDARDKSALESASLADPVMLQHMPSHLLLRSEAERWTLPAEMLPPLPPNTCRRGLFVLEMETRYIITRDDQGVIRVRRSQFPLEWASADVVHGAQSGQWPAVIADPERAPRDKPELHWLSVYVALSRAEDIAGLLLLRGTTREALETRPPDYLVAEIDRLLMLARTSHTRLQRELFRLYEDSVVPAGLLELFGPLPKRRTQKSVDTSLCQPTPRKQQRVSHASSSFPLRRKRTGSVAEASDVNRASLDPCHPVAKKARTASPCKHTAPTGYALRSPPQLTRPAQQVTTVRAPCLEAFSSSATRANATSSSSVAPPALSARAAGIKNFGNTCYANAVMQALASTQLVLPEECPLIADAFVVCLSLARELLTSLRAWSQDVRQPISFRDAYPACFVTPPLCSAQAWQERFFFLGLWSVLPVGCRCARGFFGSGTGHSDLLLDSLTQAS